MVYRGPWKTVQDDHGRTYRRGERMAVCDRTYRLLTTPAGPYHQTVLGLEPRVEVPLPGAKPYDPGRDGTVRRPEEMKGTDYRETRGEDAGGCGCGPEGCH